VTEQHSVPRLALDPALPEQVAGTLRANPEILLEVRRGRTPDPIGPDWVAVFFVVTTMIVILLVAGRGAATVFLILIALGAVLKRLAADAEERALQRVVRLVYSNADRYVLAADLDEESRTLLRRAQDAGDTVLRSLVNREGLLDTFDNAVTLPDQEWQIAARLADLTHLRDQHDEVVGDDVPEEFFEAFRPYDEAIRTATAAVTARIEALERYAEQARTADRYYDGIRRLEILRSRTSEYERMVAETARDAVAVPDIDRMSTQALAVEQVFRDSIDEAKRAAGHLLSVSAA
jgi:hypothetical protein